MYHAEGYLDRQTYFTRERITSLVIEKEKSICYFWCVWKAPMQNPGDVKALKTWFYGKLAPQLDGGAMTIRKELERFGSMGLKTPLLLCLSFQGNIYTWGEEKNGIWRFQGNRGLYLWTDPLYLRAEEALQRRYDTLEEQANSLQAGFLKSMSEGQLEQGFYFVWEDNDDF